jgi:hypothetical protein
MVCKTRTAFTNSRIQSTSYNTNSNISEINNDVTITGNLNVEGDASFNGYLDISGTNVINTLDSLNSMINAIDISLQILENNQQTLRTNIVAKTTFDLSTNHLTTTTTDIQDLSNQFFSIITPDNECSWISIDINTTLYCSYALEERITVELWRDTTKLTVNRLIGQVIATGGLSIPYHISYLDQNEDKQDKRYYLKYQLENNDSQQPMGLININTEDTTGSSIIILREI